MSQPVKDYDAQITVNDIYLIVLWDKNYFQNGTSNHGVSGKRVAEGLFSVEAFASNNKDEYKIACALAKKIRPEMMKAIAFADKELRRSLDATRAELNDPIIQAVDIPPQTKEKYCFAIAKGRGTPLVNSFIRLFVLMNETTNALKELYFRGVVSKAVYKKRENLAAKPLRKLMNDLNLIIKNYHQQRKRLDP